MTEIDKSRWSTRYYRTECPEVLVLMKTNGPAPDPECPLSELPASQCACPRHRGGHAPGDEPVQTEGRPFLARYPGRCERCEHGIAEGEAIDPVVDGGGYVHVRCPR